MYDPFDDLNGVPGHGPRSSLVFPFWNCGLLFRAIVQSRKVSRKQGNNSFDTLARIFSYLSILPSYRVNALSGHRTIAFGDKLWHRVIHVIHRLGASFSSYHHDSIHVFYPSSCFLFTTGTQPASIHLLVTPLLWSLYRSLIRLMDVDSSFHTTGFKLWFPFNAYLASNNPACASYARWNVMSFVHTLRFPLVRGARSSIEMND